MVASAFVLDTLGNNHSANGTAHRAAPPLANPPIGHRRFRQWIGERDRTENAVGLQGLLCNRLRRPLYDPIVGGFAFGNDELQPFSL